MKRATITDVAARAGVAKSTVSAVLNNKGIVADPTRRRVLRAMRELDYHPAARARTTPLSSVAPRTLGFVIKETANPYYAEVLRGIEQASRARGYRTYTASSSGDYDEERAVIEQLCAMGVAGLVITPVLHDEADLSHLFDLKRAGVPFVLLEKVPGLQSNLVDVDNVAASRRAVCHLIELGHEVIVHLAGPGYSAHSEERIQGVRQAFSESHLRFDPRHVVPAGDALEDGYRAARAVFAGPAAQHPTALTCYNDLVALGAVRALVERGLRVPQDVSVVGFDNLGLLEYTSPRLTTVDVPRYEMGLHAAAVLLDQVEAQNGFPPQKTTLAAPLVVRDSTAPPRARDDRAGRARAARMDGS